MSTFTCRIELNKTEGVTITVDNEDGEITQIIKLNGETIETTCKGKEETSTITQAPDSIKFNSKLFSVQAETIEISAKKSLVEKSEGTFDMKSEDPMKLNTSKTLTVTSDDAMTLTAKSIAMKSKSGGVQIQAASALELQGQNATLEAQSDATIKGANLNANGSMKVAVQGQMVSVSGTQIALG